MSILWLHIAVASLVLTALNAAKPVQMDDPVYLTYAAEFAALAMLFGVTDLLDGTAPRTAAREVAHGTYGPAEGGTYWHLSWWGLSYYADREGLRPLRLNVELPRPGDLIAVQDLTDLRHALAHHPEIVLSQIDTVVVGDRFPLRVMPGYYGGRTPLEHQQEGRIRVLIYRVIAVNPRSL
ncbi:hypothetical protein BH11PLA2_BH11PLA2_36110 [soil metagenome]